MMVKEQLHALDLTYKFIKDISNVFGVRCDVTVPAISEYVQGLESKVGRLEQTAAGGGALMVMLPAAALAEIEKAAELIERPQVPFLADANQMQRVANEQRAAYAGRIRAIIKNYR